MNRIFLILAMLVAASCNVSGNAGVKVVEYAVNASETSGQIGFVIDKIEFRDDLTRVYGSLAGTPHTSARIDTLTMSADGNEAVESVDIDGVDMKRWFQWEEDGLIPVEIDFPAMRPAGTIIFRLTGPKGESVWVVNCKK